MSTTQWLIVIPVGWLTISLVIGALVGRYMRRNNND